LRQAKPPSPFQASSIASLTDPATLARVAGGSVARVAVAPLQGIGFSNASISRVDVIREGGGVLGLVLKRARLDADWMARRTGDATGREALLLNEPALAPAWEVVDCPYVAFASAPGEVGLLMHDLSGRLLPGRG
jgi:hypothetical protein